MIGVMGMIAKARHPVNYNGAWHAAGEAFEVDAADAEMMEQYAEIVRPDAAEDYQRQEPVRVRGRRRKYEEG